MKPSGSCRGPPGSGLGNTGLQCYNACLFVVIVRGWPAFDSCIFSMGVSILVIGPWYVCFAVNASETLRSQWRSPWRSPWAVCRSQCGSAERSLGKRLNLPFLCTAIRTLDSLLSFWDPGSHALCDLWISDASVKFLLLFVEFWGFWSWAHFSWSNYPLGWD